MSPRYRVFPVGGPSPDVATKALISFFLSNASPSPVILRNSTPNPGG